LVWDAQPRGGKTVGFRPDLTSLLAAAAGGAVSRYIRLVHSTSTVVIDPPDARQRLHQHHPYILAMWHGQFGMMPALHIGEYKVSAIAARHGDAEVLARALSQFNIEIVRGAGANGRFAEAHGCRIHPHDRLYSSIRDEMTFAISLAEVMASSVVFRFEPISRITAFGWIC
jgi:hypothetical protein